MFAITRQHPHPRLLLAGLVLTVVLTGCGATITASRATIISETPAVQPSNTPAITIPPVTSAPTQPEQPIAVAATTLPAVQAGATSAAAVSTVLNYYDAINQHNYAQAYNTWLNGGAASKQTLEQFKQGFAKTVQVNVQAAEPSQQTNGVIQVPLTLQAVVNEPADATHDQKVQQFSGSYTVQFTGTEWKIASATITELSGAVKLPVELNDPVQLVRAYYDAINRHEYARAYTYWGNTGTQSKQSFGQFEQGFAATGHVAVELGTPQSNGAAGSTFIDVPVVIVATQTNQAQQTFCGTYTLRHLNVPPFDQFGLHIEQAKIAPVGNVQIGSDQSKQLLSGGCKS